MIQLFFTHERSVRFGSAGWIVYQKLRFEIWVKLQMMSAMDYTHYIGFIKA